MDLQYKGKVAVVTGASEGIGFAVAQEFLKEGAIVACYSSSQEKMSKAADELKKIGPEVYWEVVDGTSSKAINAFAKNVFDKFGRIDAWVNNVGGQTPRAGKIISDDELENAISKNFKSCVYGMQTAFTYMKDKGGAIINLASLAYRYPTAGAATLYGPMKAAIVQATNTFGAEYGAYGVRAVAVAPGFTKSRSVVNLIAEDHPKTRHMIEHTVLGRAGELEELAKPIVFLASPAAGFITCTVVEASGGNGTVINPYFSHREKAGGFDLKNYG